MDTPLENGRKLRSRVSYNEEDIHRRDFFNPESRTSIYHERALDKLENDLGDCARCPMCRVDKRQETDHFRRMNFVEARAECGVDTGGSCPMKDRSSGYLSDYEVADAEYLADDFAAKKDSVVEEARRDKRFVHFGTPRGRGKPTAVSEMAKGLVESMTSLEGDTVPDWIKDAERDAKIYGTSITGMTVDEALIITGQKEVVDDDLDEAVEFETNRQNYDNFGSW